MIISGFCCPTIRLPGPDEGASSIPATKNSTNSPSWLMLTDEPLSNRIVPKGKEALEAKCSLRLFFFWIVADCRQVALIPPNCPFRAFSSRPGLSAVHRINHAPHADNGLEVSCDTRKGHVRLPERTSQGTPALPSMPHRPHVSRSRHDAARPSPGATCPQTKQQTPGGKQ